MQMVSSCAHGMLLKLLLVQGDSPAAGIALASCFAAAALCWLPSRVLEITLKCKLMERRVRGLWQPRAVVMYVQLWTDDWPRRGYYLVLPACIALCRPHAWGNTHSGSAQSELR